MSKRRLTRRTETVIDVDYDYDDNPFEVEVEVEILSVWEGETLVWEGTEYEAHEDDGGATSEFLPRGGVPQLGRVDIRDDALWSLVAPLAHAVEGEPLLGFSRQTNPVFDIGAGTLVVDSVPSSTNTTLQVRGQVPHDNFEWLLVTGEESRLLAQHCFCAGANDDAVAFVVGGVAVSERVEA